MNTPLEQRVLWGAAVPASALAVALLTAAAGWFVPETYPPDARQVLPVWLPHCRPEPLEQLRYVLAVAAAPAVLWGAAAYARRAANTSGAAAWAGPRAARWGLLVQWLFCALAASAVVYQETRIHKYVDRWSFAATALGLALLGLAWRFAPSRWVERAGRPAAHPTTAGGRAVRIVLAAAPWALALAVAAGELSPGLLCRNRAFACHPDTAWHYPFFLEEFAAPANGRTVLVDYFPQYQNLLGYALAPAFRVVGLNVYTFTAAMTLLSLALLLCYFGAFRLLTGGGWRALLLFVPFVWLSMTPMSRQPAGAFEARCNDFTYLAAAPLRYLGPSLTLAALAWFLARPGRLRMMLLFLTASAAAVNNLDFGVPALGAALAAVLFSSDDGPLPRRRTALGVTAAWAAGAALAAGGFALLTWLRSGRLPDWGMAVAYQRAAVVNGYPMLPMPRFGLHWAFYLTFMAAAAVALFDRTAPRARRGLLLYAGVFGAGAMMYYVGRSHPNVLIAVFPAWGFAFLLLAWSCWSALAPRLRSEGWRALTPTAALLALGCAAVAGRFSERPNVVAQCRRLTERRDDAEGARRLLGNYAALAECVRSHAAPGERVAVIAPYGHLAAGQAGVVNVFPFSCPGSVLLHGQLAAVGRALRAGEVRQVFTDWTFPEIEQELTRLGFRRPDPGDPFYWVREEGGPAADPGRGE